MEKIYVTIIGVDYYEDLTSFELGEIIRLKKEPNNSHDPEAIKAEIPFTGRIGYVANSIKTVIKGTMSAGRIYDKVEEISYVKLIFITNKALICEFLDVEKSKTEIEAIQTLFEKSNTEELQEDYNDPIFDQKFILNEEQAFEGDIEGHVFGIGIEKEGFNKLPPEIKNKLMSLVLNTLQSKEIEPLEFSLITGEENVDVNKPKFPRISKLKETDEIIEEDKKSRISHDEVAIFTYKKEETITKYFEIKNQILDINTSINYKINNKKISFYYKNVLFASMTIDEDFVGVAIKSNEKLETETKEIKNKNSYLYEFIIKKEDEIEELIKTIRKVLKF
ncbi:MAG: HIRAN domain-containing protein [Methanobrevibacter sp.]|jgi:hypothetical protein|nr:HIRAN domain-containing protein [Candidatus Methanovirga aequatorialis]